MNIFISYRRQDSEWVTLTIFNELKKHLPTFEIFKDFNTIKPGEDFTKAIDKNLQSCNLLLVIIGKQWLNCTDADGDQRLFNDKDFVRLEIARSLKKKKTVIPVLIDDTKMPTEDELPDDLKLLHTKQSLRINNTNFELDVFNLVNAIKHATGQTSEYSDLLSDITSGKVSEQEILKPDNNRIFSIFAMAIGLVLMLINYNKLTMIAIAIAVIAIGLIAYLQAGKVIPLWLSKQFDAARAKAKLVLTLSIIGPILGSAAMFIFKKNEKKIEPVVIIPEVQKQNYLPTNQSNKTELKKLVKLNDYKVGVPKSLNQTKQILKLPATIGTTRKIVPAKIPIALKPLKDLKPEGKYPETSQRYLTYNDVRFHNKRELAIMRNEIFARKGFIFNSEEISNYFLNQNWYKPQYYDVTNRLTSIEKANIDFIKLYEK